MLALVSGERDQLYRLNLTDCVFLPEDGGRDHLRNVVLGKSMTLDDVQMSVLILICHRHKLSDLPCSHYTMCELEVR
jgi:hypothetical protein